MLKVSQQTIKRSANSLDYQNKWVKWTLKLLLRLFFLQFSEDLNKTKKTLLHTKFDPKQIQIGSNTNQVHVFQVVGLPSKIPQGLTFGQSWKKAQNVHTRTFLGF